MSDRNRDGREGRLSTKRKEPHTIWRAPAKSRTSITTGKSQKWIPSTSSCRRRGFFCCPAGRAMAVAKPSVRPSSVWSHLVFPFFQQSPEPLDGLGLTREEIVLSLRIRTEIEQILLDLAGVFQGDELHVPVTDGPTGPCSASRSPKERPRLDGLSRLEELQNIDSVEGAWSLRSCRPDDGRGEVHRHAGHALREHRRPSGRIGDPNPAFKDVALVAGERGVLADIGGTVVAHEDHQRLPGQAVPC
jgi:hypothetical protein